MRLPRRRRVGAMCVLRNLSSSVTDGHFPICIVGGGPVGLTLSSLLSHYGVKHCLLEKRETPTSHPQAHFINARSMEILQGHLPVSFRAVTEQMPESDYWRDFVYCHSVTGRALARVDHFSVVDGKFWSNTPTNVVHLPQNIFENILRREVEERKEDKSTLLYGHEVTGFEWSHPSSSKLQMHKVHFAESASRDRGDASTTSQQQPRSLSCRYLIACDGAASLTRRSLSIPLEGPSALQTLMNVHFTCPGLYNKLKPRPAMLYFVFNEGLVGVFVAHDPRKDEWVCQIPLFPPYRTRADFDDAKLLKVLHAGLGVQDGDLHNQIKILTVNTWTMHAEVAARFSDPSDTIFLAGDSAHRFPPAGGFGMNTGLQDAHNLAWKLALVEHGAAGPSLLKSYSRERRQIAQDNTALSLKNYEKSITSARLLGVDPALANIAIATLSSLPLSLSIRRSLINKALDTGLLSLAWLKNSSNALSEQRVKFLQAQINKGQELPLLFPKEDLDFEYSSEGEGAGEGQPCSANVKIKMVDGSSHLLRTMARIPHVWLGIASASASASRSINEVVSSVHLAAEFAKAYRLPITAILVSNSSPSSSNGPDEVLMWRQEAKRLGPFVKVVAIEAVGTGGDATSHSAIQGKLQVPPSPLPRSKDLSTSVSSFQSLSRREAASLDTLIDVTGCWRGSMSAAGYTFSAVAVRPDGHVCGIWGSSKAPTDEEIRAFVAGVSAH